MPYTPPSQQSPAASVSSSPALSCSDSVLKKHRRSPSIRLTDGNIHTSMSNGDSSGNGYDCQSRVNPYGSLRQSPRPMIVLDLGHQRQSPAQFGPGDGEDEEEYSDESARRNKAPMLRKKSGELVRPALRLSSAKQWPSSMPGTPTYAKAVHFDSHLEHVRHFLQVDKSLAVSAGSSPVENYESEVEFPFGYDESGRPRQQPFEWEIRVSNFPTDTQARQSLPVRVEKVFLSSDNKNLVGVVAVQNLAFQKLVVVRFTLDYWKTTSEVIADYNHDVRRRQNDGCDRFNFSIKLVDLANLENKTVCFCIRYSVNGQGYWDNNNGMNYQVDFTKKAKPQHGKNGTPAIGARSLNALPRSKPSPLMSAGTRPKTEIVPDASTRHTKAKAPAFGNRYDFGASLNAAIQNPSAVLGDQSGLKPRLDTKQSSSQVPAPASNVTQAAKGTPASTQSSRPAALLSGKPSLSSQLYQELVDKYCFVGTRK
jgi:hypothetical protein